MEKDKQLSEILEALGEKLGSREIIEQRFNKLRSVLDQDGLTSFARLVYFFTAFDQSVSAWLLRSGFEVLSALEDAAARTAVLEEILKMGRSKWSVAANGLKKLSLVSAMPSEFVTNWLCRGNRLADIDQDVAVQYFESSPAALEFLEPKQFDQWASLGHDIAGKSWKAAKEYFKTSPEVMKKIDPCDLERWARLGIHLIENSPKIKSAYGVHSLLAQGVHAGKAKVIDLAIQYFKSAPQILGRLSVNDLEAWVKKGLGIVEEEKEKGAAYFSLQTGSSRDTVETLVKGLELRDIHSVLTKYVGALTDRKIHIRSSAVFYKNLPGLSRFFTVTDATRIFLPSMINVFEDEDMNFKTYKCSLSHEIAHILFGTFEVNFHELERLSELDSPVQAFKIFEFLEDERVDYLMGQQYPGLEKDRQMIMDVYRDKMPSGGNGKKCVFASLGFNEPGSLKSTEGNQGGLALLLKEALTEVRKAEQTVLGVVDLTVKICDSIEGKGALELCECHEAYERIFYRGIIDYALIEESRSGTSKLVLDMSERFEDRNREVSSEHIEEALIRIEESAGPESDVLLWQINEADKLDELFDRVETVVSDIEEESRIRRSVFYDEWDMKLEDYKKDWCKVREMEMPSTTLLFYNQTINEHYGLVSLLRRHFGLLRPDRVKRYFREERGDDFDLDALIESVVERHAGVTPSDKVYIRRDKKLRDVSVAFLVDMSYSTSEELPSGKRIVDIEREALILMGEALESIGDQWAVYGFSTDHREKVDFYVVRDFNEPFTDEVKMRFESIRPMAQTRLGAAIRHANSLLARQDSLIRLLILMSDGRPYDIDYGDVYYSVEDTRMALWEGRSKGLSSYCITVDKRSREYLPHMYGESNYTIIDNIEYLPTTLPLIYKRLTT
jgi:hypothetical protein